MVLNRFWVTLAVICFTISSVNASAIPVRRHIETTPRSNADSTPTDNAPRVLILGGGVAGIIAARTLKQHGIHDFLLIEGRDELGGRMRSHQFAGHAIEVGANWIQGTRSAATGRVNPILDLAEKHGLVTHASDPYGSIGQVDYIDVVNEAIDAHERMIASAGARVIRNLVDTTSQTGYGIVGAKPRAAHELASEYLFDWEFAQKPDQTSWVASSWVSNFTFNDEAGGFSDENLLSIDQRGFKALIQGEAEEFIEPDQILLNTSVGEIQYSDEGVSVITTDGSTYSADYAICTFSLGVLQNDDVAFSPPLPDYKVEAIQSMTMATYTKVFMKFPEKFWLDTEFALYADPERVVILSGKILTSRGDYSKRIEALPFEQVQSEVMSVLRSMYPDTTIPEPTDFYFHRWNSDPLYRGSYSNWPPSFFSGHHDNLRANMGRLYFAGEATSERYYGYLHGAYFEGQDIAKMVAKCINEMGCVHMTRMEEVVNAHPYRTAYTDN